MCLNLFHTSTLNRNHTFRDVAPCIANQGLVIYDMKPEHMLIDPMHKLIGKNKFVLIDTDGWTPPDW